MAPCKSQTNWAGLAAIEMEYSAHMTIYWFPI